MKIIKSDDTWGNRLRWTAVKIKARLGRGLGWFDYLRYMAYTILAVMGVEKGLFAVNSLFGWNISLSPHTLSIMYIALPPLVFVVAYLLAYLDELYGFWKHEIIYGTRNLNPFMQELEGRVKKTEEMTNRIYETVNKILEELKRINSH